MVFINNVSTMVTQLIVVCSVYLLCVSSSDVKDQHLLSVEKRNTGNRSNIRANKQSKLSSIYINNLSNSLKNGSYNLILFNKSKHHGQTSNDKSYLKKSRQGIIDIDKSFKENNALKLRSKRMVDSECRGIDLYSSQSLISSMNDVDDDVTTLENIHRCFCISRLRYNWNRVQCFDCFDNLYACKIYGLCCSDYKKWANITTTQQLSSETLTGIPLKSTPIPVCQDGALLINSCPENYTSDNETRALCEDQIPTTETTVDVLVHVIDSDTKISYKNKHCAKCNQAKQIRFNWELTLECSTFLHVYKAVNMRELLSLGLQTGSRCYVNQQASSMVDIYKCNGKFWKRKEDEQIINSCGVIGHSTTYNSRVEQACRLLPDDLTLRIDVEGFYGRIFKNLFCFMCNDISQLLAFESSGSYLPFVVTFDLNDEATSNALVNASRDMTEWKDPTGYTRPVLCSDGKILNSGRCETALSFIVGLPYRLTLVLVSLNHYNDSAQDISELDITETTRILEQEIYRQFNDIFTMIIVESQIGVILHPQVLQSNLDTPLFLLPQLVWVQIFFYGRGFSREYTENHVLKPLHRSVVNITMMDYYISSYKLYFIEKFFDDKDNPCKKMSSTLCNFRMNKYDYDDNYIYIADADIMNRADFIDIGPYLVCPYIQLSDTEIQVQETSNYSFIPHTTQLTLSFGQGHTVSLVDSFEINQIYRGDDNVFYVCLDLLKSKFPNSSQEKSFLIPILSKLVIVCLSFSSFMIFFNM